MFFGVFGKGGGGCIFFVNVLKNNNNTQMKQLFKKPIKSVILQMNFTYRFREVFYFYFFYYFIFSNPHFC